MRLRRWRRKVEDVVKQSGKRGHATNMDAPSISEEIGKLLDQRAEALARDPNQRKYILQEIAARHNVKL